jgi:hypothetical protein
MLDAYVLMLSARPDNRDAKVILVTVNHVPTALTPPIAAAQTTA